MSNTPPKKTPSFDAAISFAQDLIKIPSMPGEEGDLAKRVVEEMEDLGYDEVWTDEMGNVVGVLKGPSGGPSIMLSAHLDMVAEGDVTEWEHPPFDAVIADGFLHGRGAMDIKGPLAIQTHTAVEIRDQAVGDIIVAHPVYEERGGWGMDYLVRKEGGLRPDVVVIGESTHGDIALGHRGRAEIEIVIQGLAGHASAPERARNALEGLPAAMTAVKALQGTQESDPILGRSSVVATDVRAVPESANVIPDKVMITLDWRILPSDTYETLIARVEEVLAAHRPDLPEGLTMAARAAVQLQRTYTGVAESRKLFSPGFLMEADHPTLLAAAQAVGRRDGTSNPATIRPWTFATDGGWTLGIQGIPTLGFAPGEERHAHTNTERLELEEAAWGYEAYMRLILAVQKAADATM